MANENEPALAGADDAALYNDVIANPEPLHDPAPPPEPLNPEPPPEPTIPAARLREEKDARRVVERERDDFRRQLDAMISRQPPPPKQDAPKRSDLFEAPSAFVQEEVTPLIDPVRERMSQITEHYSLRSAVGEHGKEKVTAARTALQSAMGARDPEAWGVYNRAMASIDPYGEIMNWHTSKEVISTVGTDLKAYREKILDEALKDPEFQKRAYESMRGAAAMNGNVSRPAVPKLPSIGKVGAAASSADNSTETMSDDELFREATRRR